VPLPSAVIQPCNHGGLELPWADNKRVARRRCDQLQNQAQDNGRHLILYLGGTVAAGAREDFSGAERAVI